jgi:malate dehydrogenase
MEKKIAVIGAGNVGASAALYLAEANVADIVLLDVVEGMPQGKALDLTEAGPVRGYNSRLIGSNNYQDLKGCDLVVVTAGVARTPGMSREDLLSKNSGILDKVVEGIMNNCPEALILVVSNPLDIMTYHTLKKSGLAKNRVFGQAGVLDATRFRSFVAMELGVALTDTQAMVMGGHGDTMVPLPRYTTVSGIPIAELMPAQRVKALIERTRKGGGEIVQLLKSGSAYYAPAAAVVDMVKAVIRDEKKLLPASVLLEGQYGLKDICIGVPVVLGAGGVEKIIELELTEEELAALHNSAETYREILTSMGYSG